MKNLNEKENEVGMDNDKIREYKNKIRKIKKTRKREAKRMTKYCIRKMFADLGLVVDKIRIDNGNHRYDDDVYYYEFVTVRFNGKKDKINYFYSESDDNFIISLNNCIGKDVHNFIPTEYRYVSNDVQYYDNCCTFESDAGNLYKIKLVDTIDNEYYTKIYDTFTIESVCCFEILELIEEHPILEYRRLALLLLLSHRHKSGDFSILPKDIAVIIAKKVYAFRY